HPSCGTLRLVSGDVLLDPPQSKLQLVLRLRVSEANESFAPVPERGPRQDRHARLAEQPPRELMLVEAGALDIGEGIKRALRPRASHARNLVDAVHHQVAPV